MKFTIAAVTTFIVGVSAWGKQWQSHYADFEQGRRGHQHVPGRGAEEAMPATGNSTFKQLIDHNNPSLGTFDQFYYYSTEFWKGPGSPVVMFTPGEINVTGYNSYLSINRTTGVLAQELGAAGMLYF